MSDLISSGNARELGGHPRRHAHSLLREHFLPGSPAFLRPEVQWVDLAQHVERVWHNYVGAVTRHSPSNVYTDRFERIAGVFAEWHASDPLPRSI